MRAPLVTASPSSLTLCRPSARLYPARTASQCSAAPFASFEPGSDIPPAAWDPEGLLEAAPAGGHFARREQQQQLTAAAAEAAAAAPPVPSSFTLANQLLAPKTRKNGLPKTAIAVPPVVATSAPASDEIIAAPASGVGASIDAAFRETFWGERAAPRVLKSFRRLLAGQEHVQLFPGLGLQRAESYVEGLTANPFPDPYSGVYPWLVEVEGSAAIVQAEFAALGNDPGVVAKGQNVWVPAARKDALGYGRDWRTLVLQDRGQWDPINSKLFPRTTKLMKDVKAPTLEVFFAKQIAGTGISSHTDNANFVQTSHLGLQVPEGHAWIKCGDHTRYWENGKVITMDTSFLHETANESPDTDRYVLIMRHWHPEMTALERIATMFLFNALDNQSAEGIKAAQKAAQKAMSAGFGVKKGGKKKGGGGGAGFG